MRLFQIMLALSCHIYLSRAQPEEPTCGGAEAASTQQELNMKELLYLNEAAELYRQKIANLEKSIAFKKEQVVN